MNKSLIFLVLCLLALTVSAQRNHQRKEDKDYEWKTQQRLREWEEKQNEAHAQEQLEATEEQENNLYGKHSKNMKNSSSSSGSQSESESESEEFEMRGQYGKKGGQHNKHEGKKGHHGRKGHHGKKGHHYHHGKPGPECVLFLIIFIIVVALVLRCCFKKCHKRKLKKIARQRQQLQNSGFQVPQVPFQVPQPVYVQNAQPLYSTVDANGVPHIVMGAPMPQPQPQQQQPQQVWGVHLNQQQQQAIQAQPVQAQPIQQQVISQPAQVQQPTGVYVPPRQQQQGVVQSPEGYESLQMTDKSQYPQI